MKHKFNLYFLIVLIAGATVIFFSKPALVQPNPTDSSPPELFAPIETRGRGIATPEDPTVVRQRLVRADFELLTRTRGQALRLNLFEDVAYTVIIERIDTPSGGQARGQSSSVQFGRIEGIPNSEVYLANRGDVLSGNVRLPDGTLYQIRYLRSGVHAVREIDTSAFPPDHPPEAFRNRQERSTLGDEGIVSGELLGEIPASRGRGEGDTADPTTEEIISDEGAIAGATARNDDSVLDVLVAYTSAVREAVGGTDAMNVQIDTALEETNQGFINSDIDRRVRIVRRVEVDYLESGSGSTDLDRLINPTDNFLDELPILRRESGADAVSLWVEDFPEGCGVGATMFLAPPYLGFREQAYSVVKYTCATGNFSFAHELGHNLGATHDKDNAPGRVIYPYAYGYRDPEGEFRTIMAYADGCPGECPRVNYWSNPDLTYQGEPLGIPGQADNARTLAQTLPIAADWSRPANARCFSEQVYWAGNRWPQTWLQEQIDKDYLLTSVAEKNGQLAFVMSQPLEYAQWIAPVNDDFPEQDIQQLQNSGGYITDVGVTENQWVVVVSGPTTNPVQQDWAISSRFPADIIERSQNEDRFITSLGAKANRWAVVTSSSTDYSEQTWTIDENFPQTQIEQGWQAGMAITGLAATEERFAAVMSQPTDYTRQAWVVAGSFPEAWIQDKQRAGYAITNLAATSERWAVVMSQCE